MKTIINIKKIALIFFILTGILHLGSSILIANQLYLKQAQIFNKIMDAPLLLTGLMYAFSSFRLAVTDPRKSHKIIDSILITITVAAFAGIIVISILIPDI